MSSDYLDHFTADTLPDLEECVLISNDGIRFTPTGIKRYRGRFAHVGIDIATVTSLSAFNKSLKASFIGEMETFARRIERNGGDRLEQRYLVALLHGEPESARLEKLLSRRNRLGLTLLK